MSASLVDRTAAHAAKAPCDFHGQARASVAATIAGGAEGYDRQRHLPRLLPLMPSELADQSTAAQRSIVARFPRALRAERARGRAGHWTYDLNRHIALSQAYVAERRLLDLAHRPPAIAQRTTAEMKNRPRRPAAV